MTEEQQRIIDWLTLLKQVCQHNGAEKSGFHYAGPGDLLLQHGKWYEPTTPVHYEGALPKSCFRNAALASKEFGWRYVEGYAYNFFPQLHAWCLDQCGVLKEVTWKPEHTGAAYFGIKFRLDQVFASGGSVLESPRGKPDIFRQAFKEE